MLCESIVSSSRPWKVHCLRLHRGDDLLECIRELCEKKQIRAGVVLSAVGCILKGRIRDASGVNIRCLDGHYEIVSLNGTVSQGRCHLHIALSAEDLHTIGGHLCTGCIINTTCELIIAELEGIEYGVELDPETGYDELIFTQSNL